MPFAQAEDGVRIAYETHGSGNLKIILLHGWGGSASYWRDLVSHLNLQGLQIIAASYRGHGDSDSASRGYTLDGFAKDILAVADAAGAHRFVLVGFSMSGKFAQYIAALHPERVLGLVLIAPVPASEFPVPAEMAKAWCDTQRDRAAAFDTILAPFTRIPVKRELTELFLDDFAKAARPGLEETLKMCGVSFVPQAKQIRIPTLALAGSYDPLLPPDLLKSTLMTQISGIRMLALPCGHEIPQEMPEQTAALIEAFLSGMGQTALIEAAAA
ncbi:MAG TPA: alpha/beta hydrolase [Candidatus Sulfotelmatobacter sp.]|nr:alpha/beta hydrolase [Candidatus Sulfotelmatobacter sp.]